MTYITNTPEQYPDRLSLPPEARARVDSVNDGFKLLEGAFLHVFHPENKLTIGNIREATEGSFRSSSPAEPRPTQLDHTTVAKSHAETLSEEALRSAGDSDIRRYFDFSSSGAQQ